MPVKKVHAKTTAKLGNIKNDIISDIKKPTLTTPIPLQEAVIELKTPVLV